MGAVFDVLQSSMSIFESLSLVRRTLYHFDLLRCSGLHYFDLVPGSEKGKSCYEGK